MGTPFGLSQDGIESQFSINHFAHCVLTDKLIPVLEASQPSRIVILSSLSHTQVDGIRYDDLNDTEKYVPMSRYGETKLANLHFAKELQERLMAKALKNGKECQIYVNSVHPGVVYTELGRDFPKAYHIIAPYLMISPYKGALTQLYAAAATQIETNGIRNKYFVPFCSIAPPTKYATDKELSLKTWYWTEKVLKEKFRQDWNWASFQ